MIKGNPDKFARFMLLAVSEEAKTSFPFCFCSMYNKQLSDSVFVTSKITADEGLGKVCIYQPEPNSSATATLIILDIETTSSNTCIVTRDVIFCSSS